MVDTVRRQNYLLESIFQTGQANGSIDSQDMRDFIVSSYNVGAQITISELSDFPTPSGGVITLEADKVYLIACDIDLGVNVLDASAGAVGFFGTSSEVITLQTTSATAMITSTDSVTAMHMKFLNDSGACFAMGGAGKFYRFNDITVTSAATDTVTGGVAAVFTNARWAGGAAGLTISGAYTAVLFRSCGFFSLTGTPTMLTLAAGSTPNIFNVEGSQFLTSAGQTGLDIDSAIVPATSGQVTNSIFDTSGIPLDAGGIDATSVNWTFKDNVGIVNTRVHGWENISDSVYHVANKRSITDGTRTQLTIDGLASSTNTTYDPVEGTLWNSSTNKFTPGITGAAYDLRLQITASYDSGAAAHVDLEIDIGGALNTIYQESKIFSKGSNVTNNMAWSIPIFTLGTFIANGGTIYITPQDSDIKIWDAKLLIVQTFNPEVGL